MICFGLFLDIVDVSVDLVLLFDVFEYVFELEFVIDDIWCMLKLGGCLIVSFFFFVL